LRTTYRLVIADTAAVLPVGVDGEKAVTAVDDDDTKKSMSRRRSTQFRIVRAVVLV
jgi:hypothetical protein